MINSWKNIAKQKQLQFKKDLKLTESGTFNRVTYKHILADKDAKNGANFYCYNNPTEWRELQTWADKDSSKKINYKGLGLKNMLRSEHIPYNLFFPLEKLRTSNPQLLNRFIEQLLDNAIKVNEVTKIKIEYAGSIHKSKLLNDNTSFDVYIEYLSDGKKGGIGIEVKYTELSYPYGKTEEARMFGIKPGEYLPLTKRCGYYHPEAQLKLKEKKLKQHWRNHLLGIKMLEIGALDEFHSVHLYPKGNTYQTEVCKQYKACLKERYKQSFVPITFEYFIAKADTVLGKEDYIVQNDWINYLKKRY